MFNFFSKKEEKPKVEITVYITKVMKYKTVMSNIKDWLTQGPVLLLYFFDQTQTEVIDLLNAMKLSYTTGINENNGGLRLISAHQLEHLPKTQNAKAVIIELHPSAKISAKAESLIAAAGINDTTIFVAIDEAFPKAFGGDRIGELLENMGATQNDSFTNKMIIKSFRTMQEKIDQLHPTPHDIRTSVEDWLEKHKPTR